MSRIITVFGATGAQGGGLARAILTDPQQRFRVRAVTRKPDSPAARALSEIGADNIVADLDDAASVRRAMDGAHGAFCVTNFWEHFSPEKELAQATTMAQTALDAGVKHVVWSTLEDTRQWMPAGDTRMPMLQDKYRVPHFDAKAEADAYFAGLPTTFLRTSFYWDNLYMFGLAPKKNDQGQYEWTFPLGNAKMAGIGAEDIGKTAYGIFKAGSQYIGKTVGIAGEFISVDEMGQKLTKHLGIGPVKYNAVDANVYRGFGFPGADEMGNMFQVYRDFEGPFNANRNIDVARQLNPALMNFDQWVAANKAKIPV
jgi:uncharacterized protein YbjT (DUF2867 family)